MSTTTNASKEEQHKDGKRFCWESTSGLESGLLLLCNRSDKREAQQRWQATILYRFLPSVSRSNGRDEETRNRESSSRRCTRQSSSNRGVTDDTTGRRNSSKRKRTIDRSNNRRCSRDGTTRLREPGSQDISVLFVSFFAGDCG